MKTSTRTLSASTLLRMTRPGFLVITVVGCLLGFASAGPGAWTSHGSWALWALLLATGAHAAGNVLNDYHDAVSGADEANQQGLFPFSGGSRLIQTGEVDLATTRRVAWGLLAVVAAGGMALALAVGPGLWAVGALGLLLAWAYSAPPLRLMGRGLGEATVAGVWWLVVLGTDHVLRGGWSATPAWAGWGWSLLIANILLINGFPDAPADAQVGKRTWVVIWGPAVAAGTYAVLGVVAHLAVLWAVRVGGLPAQALWALVAAPLSLAASGLLWQRRHQAGTLRPAIVLTIAAAVLHGLALALGLWLSARP